MRGRVDIELKLKIIHGLA